ncbi:ATPase [Altererythrobacter aquiaggeris]|uniref:ATPase n=1 Tax=Aestuarierythrobacter aquiaggeris TaxID=1898396 RepID=UPI0030167242
MIDRSRLVAIDAGPEPEEAEFEEISENTEELRLDESWAEDWPEDEDKPPRDLAWALPAFAGVVVAAWSGFFGWLNWSRMSSGATPQMWSDWIGDWAVPVLLVVAVWLLVMRNSRKEASRFADTAQSLSAESARLETRLGVINRELSLAREFLAAQSRELESLGRIASERLSEHADRLQTLVITNGAQVDSIAEVSVTALGNMDKLRDDLPVIANSARDVSNQIGAAGQNAQQQLEELVSGFNRLNDFGQASERQVIALGENIGATLARFEAQTQQLDDIVRARFDALTQSSEEFRTDLDNREVAALAAIRRRADALTAEIDAARGTLEEQEEEALRSLRARLGGLKDESTTIARSVQDGQSAALGVWQNQIESLRVRLVETILEVQTIDERAIDSANARLDALRTNAQTVDEKALERNQLFGEQMENRRADIAADEQAASHALSDQMARFDAALAERRAEHASHAANMEAQGEMLAARLAELEAHMLAITAQSEDAERRISGGSDELAARLGESRELLDTTGSAISALTDASVRLLELIQASARHSGEELSASVGMAEERLGALTLQAGNVRSIIAEADEKGRGLSDYVITAQDHGKLAENQIAALHGKIRDADEQHVAYLDKLQSGLAALHDESVRVAEASQGELRDAIAVLEHAASTAVASLGNQSAAQTRALADSIGDQAARSIDEALRHRTSEVMAELDIAATRAANTGREAAIQLRDQLAMVNELTGNLETRVTRARERAQEQVDNDFARRVALITESLNSNAIDIAKSLSSDVTDTSWAAYLRGDRGIFTRRAVRLLDNQEAREIALLYEEDGDFNDHVSRYIHDFEAMLRSLLSTRDGNALGVTLLSSDMGKLYVALAQAIERLRE